MGMFNGHENSHICSYMWQTDSCIYTIKIMAAKLIHIDMIRIKEQQVGMLKTVEQGGLIEDLLYAHEAGMHVAQKHG